MRRTLNPHRALRFPTEQMAAAVAHKLGYFQAAYGRPDRFVAADPAVFYVVSRLEEADLPRPRPEPSGHVQPLFAFAWEPASPPSSTPESATRRRKAKAR